jgi:hypothetical protein
MGGDKVVGKVLLLLRKKVPFKEAKEYKSTNLLWLLIGAPFIIPPFLFGKGKIPDKSIS